MTKFARRFTSLFAITLALAFALSGSAEANRAAAAKAKVQAKDGRQARTAVLKNYKAKGRSTNVRVAAFGPSKSGKSLQVLVATKASGKVRALNVRNGVAYETKTQAKSQDSARLTAHQNLRRQNGTFSGVRRSGLSNSGKSYKFTSKTDNSPKTGDKAYVNARTGKVSVDIKGK
jgi:hypothetical protein